MDSRQGPHREGRLESQRNLVSLLARKHGVDKKSRTFTPWSHVVSMLYAHLGHCLSLNDVADGLRLHGAYLKTIRQAVPPSRNGLSHANMNRTADMAEELFWSVLAHFQYLNPQFGYGHGYVGIPRRFKRVIHAIDSTTLQLRDFLGNSENAVRWQIWTAMLAYILLRFIKDAGKWTGSFARLFTCIRAALWCRGDLYNLLQKCLNHRTKPRPEQVYLPGFEPGVAL